MNRVNRAGQENERKQNGIMVARVHAKRERERERGAESFLKSQKAHSRFRFHLLCIYTVASLDQFGFCPFLSLYAAVFILSPSP